MKDYFKNGESSCLIEYGFLNNLPKFKIDYKTCIFKFINLQHLNLTKKSELLIIYLQFINSCKKTNYTESNFPFEFPYKSSCNLFSESNEFGDITFTSSINLTPKKLDLFKKELKNEYNTFSDAKCAYLNYFINFIETKESKYLQYIINPFLKYGLEILSESDSTTYINVDYSLKNNNCLNGNMFALHNNLIKLFDIEKIKKFDLEGLKNLSESEKANKENEGFKKLFNIYLFIFSYLNDSKYVDCLDSENKEIKEAISEISKKYGVPYKEIEKIVLNDINNIFI
jgi:hypothetical protein